MTLLVSTAIIGAMAFLVLFRPLAALLLYGASATYADGFGVSEWLGETAVFDAAMNGLFVILFIRATFWILAKPLGRSARRNGLLALTIVAWCVLGSLVGGSSLFGTISILPYLALPYVIIWIAFADFRASTDHLVALVAVQSCLAIAVLLVPAFGFLQGNLYSPLVAGITIDRRVQLWLPDAATIKSAAGNHYAQFHNPNVLGFYAVAAVSVGLYLLLLPRTRARLGGAFALLAGAFLWINSLTRGPMIGLIGMIAVWWVLYRDSTSQRKSTTPFLLVIVAIVAILLSIAGPRFGLLDFLIPTAGDVSVTGRLSGFEEAWKLILENPVFGFDVSYQWESLARPHFIGLLFGAEYGVLAGILITWLIFGGAGLMTLRALRAARFPKADSLFVATLFGTMIGIAATNNFAGPLLFAAILGHLIVAGSDTRASEIRSVLSDVPDFEILAAPRRSPRRRSFG